MDKDNLDTVNQEDPEEIITYREIKASEETFLLKIYIPDQPQIGECTTFIDTGEEANLVSAHCFHALDPNKYPLMSTSIRMWKE